MNYKHTCDTIYTHFLGITDNLAINNEGYLLVPKLKFSQYLNLSCWLHMIATELSWVVLGPTIAQIEHLP